MYVSEAEEYILFVCSFFISATRGQYRLGKMKASLVGEQRDNTECKIAKLLRKMCTPLE